MKLNSVFLAAASTLAFVSFAQAETTLTIATVNNSDMIRMQKLSKTFEAEHPEIKLNWVVLEENVLRQRLTTDIATQGGPGNSTLVPGLEIYYLAFFQREVGQASALAVALMVLVLAVVLPLQWINRESDS